MNRVLITQLDELRASQREKDDKILKQKQKTSEVKQLKALNEALNLHIQVLMERNNDLLRQFESFYNTVEKVKSMFSQELKAKLNVTVIRSANQKRIAESYAIVENVEAMLADHNKTAEVARQSTESVSRGEYSYTRNVRTVEVKQERSVIE